RQRDLAAYADRSLAEGANPTSDHVDDVRFDPFDGCRIDVLVAQVIDIGRKSLGKRADCRPRKLPCRIALRIPDPRSSVESGSASRQIQKGSTGELHGFS